MPDYIDHKDSPFNLRQDVFVCLFLVITTLAVYWQVQHFDFVNFDDDLYVFENQHVQEGLTLKNIVWAFTTTHASNWHPLTWLSHMLDYQLFGLNPGRHHRTNLLFHIANTLLLFYVFRKMTGNLWQSAFVAALFALHPLHVESVAWVSERKDVLSAFFWMLTMWGYIRYVERPKLGRYLWVVLFFILGLMSKPMLVTLPFVLLLLDYWPLNRLQIDPSGTIGNSQLRLTDLRLVWEKLPLFFLVAVSSAITFYAQKHGGAVASLDVIPFQARIANALVSYASYIGKMIYPFKLAVPYPHPGTFPWWQITEACLLLLFISLLTIRAIKQKPYFFVGWLWYIGTLVPVIGLVQVGSQSMADRYTYVPFVGLFFIIAWGVPELIAQWRYKKIWLATMAGVLVSILMPATWKQVGYWKNSITLFEHTLQVTSNNFASHNNLGLALEKLGRTKDAIEHYLQALRIKPDSVDAHNNIGNALFKQGKDSEALTYFNQALRLNPKCVAAYNSLAVAFIRMGKTDEAIAFLQKALQINPNDPDAHVNLGGALVQTGRIDEAIVHFRKALQIKPFIPEVHVNLGVALANTGKVQEAITRFRKALQIDPDNPEALENLNKTLATLEEIDREIEYSQKQLALAPEDPLLHYNLGTMYKMKGQLDMAEDYYQKAIALQPEFPEALYELAKLYIRRDEYEKALSLYHKIIAFLPDNPAGYYNIACIYARWDKPDESVSWLQKAVAKGFNDWEHIKTDEDLDNIRGSSSYKAFIKGN